MMKYASILALAAAAQAHMFLEYPVPYGQPDNNPLDSSGSNFPCKNPDYSVKTENAWNAGETKEIKFKGSATHGGGSCQFSITTDTNPTKDSQWKVIHSVMGGCPANTAGNLAENPNNGNGLNSYPVTLPSDLPSGEYSFAWTWFNKIGNREMYMQCAPITVSGGKGGDVSSALGGLPDMFVANLPPQECSTSEGQDLKFPNPGESVETGSGASLGFDVTGSGCKAQEALGAGSGSLGSPKTPTNGGGVFAPGASASPSSAPTPPANDTPAIETPAIETPVNDTPADAPSNGGGNGGFTGEACSTEGAVVCIGSSKFGICANGIAQPMDLAAGTVCSNGVISAATKRSVKFPRGHIHARHGSRL